MIVTNTIRRRYPVFNEAKPFLDGKAMVCKGGHYAAVEDGPGCSEVDIWWLIDKIRRKLGRIKN